jgi:hypothetical protein
MKQTHDVLGQDVQFLADIRTTYYYYYYYYWWGGTKSLGTTATTGLLYKPQMIADDDFWIN